MYKWKNKKYSLETEWSKNFGKKNNFFGKLNDSARLEISPLMSLLQKAANKGIKYACSIAKLNATFLKATVFLQNSGQFGSVPTSWISQGNDTGDTL